MSFTKGTSGSAPACFPSPQLTQHANGPQLFERGRHRYVNHPRLVAGGLRSGRSEPTRFAESDNIERGSEVCRGLTCGYGTSPVEPDARTSARDWRGAHVGVRGNRREIPPKSHRRRFTEHVVGAAGKMSKELQAHVEDADPEGIQRSRSSAVRSFRVFAASCVYVVYVTQPPRTVPRQPFALSASGP